MVNAPPHTHTHTRTHHLHMELTFLLSLWTVFLPWNTTLTLQQPLTLLLFFVTLSPFLAEQPMEYLMCMWILCFTMEKFNIIISPLSQHATLPQS